MAKKTATMIQRLKKWKKFKGISKEDIQKYGTPDEIKLFEGFEEEHGIEEPAEEAEEMGDEIEVEGMEDEGMEDEGVEDEGMEDEEIVEGEQPSDDLLANLIASADDEILMVMMSLITDELESRGMDADVTVKGGEEFEGEESPEHEAEESPAEEEMEEGMEDETL